MREGSDMVRDFGISKVKVRRQIDILSKQMTVIRARGGVL